MGNDLYTYLGIDFGFWNNRLNGSIELYSNNTKDLLIDFPVNGTGYNTQARNIGETSNKGIEFQLNGVISIQKIGDLI